MSCWTILFVGIVTALIIAGIAIGLKHGRGDCDFWDD